MRACGIILLGWTAIALAGLARAQAEPIDYYAWQKAESAEQIETPAHSLALRVVLEKHNKYNTAKFEPREWPAIEVFPFCDGEQGVPITQRLTAYGNVDRIFPEADLSFSPACFGEIRVADAANPELDEFRRDYGGHFMSFRYEIDAGLIAGDDSEPLLQVRAGRLHPGILVQCPHDLMLFAGDKHRGCEYAEAGLKYFAAGTGSEYTIKDAGHLDELPLDTLDQGWLLCWWGENSFLKSSRAPNMATIHRGEFKQYGSKFPADIYDADCPFLLIFEHAPASLESGAEGLGIRFPEGGNTLIMPLMGALFPDKSQTEKWGLTRLPEDIVKRCAFWAGHSRKFPVGVGERYSYDQSKDRTVITEEFVFENIREHGEVCAPVPPLMSLAREGGFPVEFSSPLGEPGYCTTFGPYNVVPGVERYEMTFSGLGRYCIGQPPGEPGSGGKDPLRAMLEREVEAILAAGHLAPWHKPRKNVYGWAANFGLSTIHLVHENPGETLYTLARALPHLPAGLRERVIAYLKEEREAYPPERIARLRTDQGARREVYGAGLSAEYLDMVPANSHSRWNNANCAADQNFYVRQKLVPRESVYHLAYYHTAVGAGNLAEKWPELFAVLQPYMEFSDWATGGWRLFPDIIRFNATWGSGPFDPWYGLGGVIDANNHFNAAVGVVQCGRLLGDRDAIASGMGMLARAAALRLGQGFLKDYYYAQGLLSGDALLDGRAPYVLSDRGAHLSQITGNSYNDAVPFLCMGMGPELGRLLRDHGRDGVRLYYEGFIDQAPDWHFAWTGHGVEGESDIAYPHTSLQIFLAQAYALEAPAAQLAAWLDAPWHPRGDLYFIEKLVAVLDAQAAGR